MRLDFVSIPYLIDESLDMSKVHLLGTMHQADHGWIKRYLFSLLFLVFSFFKTNLSRAVKVILSTKRDDSNYPKNVRLNKGTRKIALQRIRFVLSSYIFLKLLLLIYFRHVNEALPPHLKINFKFSKDNLCKPILKGIYISSFQNIKKK